MAEKEYIERNNVISHKRPFTEFDEGGWSCEVQAVAVEDIQNMPAADVAPVRHGCWENPTKKFPYYDWKCSECGCEEYRHIDRHGQYREMNFCPNCGAKMDRSENDRT